MTQKEFFKELSRTTKSYKWDVTKTGKITGTAKNGKSRGTSVDPITAVCRYTGNGSYSANKTGRTKAGKQLGLTTGFVASVGAAVNNTSNRGDGQVVRGRVKKALKLA